MSVTGIVHTKNEERNIARALRSLQPLCDELLVADMNSSDRTVEIAESMGARILHVPDFGYADPAWPLAVDEVRTRWAIRIDADEIIPPTLVVRLREVVDRDEADVVEIGRRNFMFGRPLRGTGWGAESDRHYFFFKPNSVQRVSPDDAKVHTSLLPVQGVRTMRLPLSDGLVVWHFNYTDWDHFVSKMNRYTSIEAKELFTTGSSARLSSLLFQVAKQTGKRGIVKQAWRDGYRGAGLVWIMATYRILVHLKMRQLRDVGDEAAIRSIYDRVAGDLLT